MDVTAIIQIVSNLGDTVVMTKLAERLEPK